MSDALPTPTPVPRPTAPPPPVRLPPFDVDALRLHGLQRVVALFLSNPPRWLLALQRTLFPRIRLPAARPLGSRWLVPVLPSWVMLTRDADVRRVLGDPKRFPVWWGADLAMLNDGDTPGTPFLLGLDMRGHDQATYDAQLRVVMTAFRRDDAASLVATRMRAFATGVVEAAGDQPLDAVDAILSAGFLDTCEHYFGVPLGEGGTDRREVFGSLAAVSGFLFGPPFNAPFARGLAKAGADRIRRRVDASIARARQFAVQDERTVLGRLLKDGVADDQVRAILMGLIVGSVPTNVMAAGHILDTLLSQPQMLLECREAALADDDPLLARRLFEVLRFRPINPGPWRVCDEDTVIGDHFLTRRRIRKGTQVMACTQSAMFDPRRVSRPSAFDPARDPSTLLHFGHGLHFCVGKFIAEAQITQALKPLVRRAGLRRADGSAGQLGLLGVFPERLCVTVSERSAP